MPVLIKKGNPNLQQVDAPIAPIPTMQHAPAVDINDNHMSLQDILGVFKRRKITILLTLFSTLAIASIYTFMTKPSYRANAILQIEREGAEIVDFGRTHKPADAVSSENDPFFRTRYELLKSRVISQKVINELNLKESLAPTNKKSSFAIPRLSSLFGSDKKPDDKTVNSTDYNAIFNNNLLVKPITGTHLVEVFYEAPSATEAKNIVTSILNNFIKLQIETKSETSEYAKEFLSKQLIEAKKHLQVAEKSLVEYANEKGILEVDEKQTRHVKKLGNLDDALVQAEINRIEAESLYLQMKKSGSVSTVLTNPVITSLKARMVRLEGDYQEMLKTFKPNYPDMKRLKQQINSTRGELQKEMGNIQRSMKADFLAAKNQEDRIRSELSQFNQEMHKLQDSSLDYNTLKREVDSRGKIYKNLQQRLQEVSVASAANTSSISIVEPAITPLNRYRPKPKLNVLLGLLSGIILGLGFAFLKETLDQKVKSSEDLERITGLPVLGMIPRFLKSTGKEIDIFSCKALQSPAAEAYRILATNLRLMFGQEDDNVMLITSVYPEEGKSTTAANIACSYTKTGKKVLLVDADIRNSSLHKRFGLSNKKGLSDYLKGESDLVGITKPVSNIQGLFAITAGKYDVDPVSLLSHERMSYLTTQGASIFDYVIIDAPPVEGFADSLVLSSLASSTLIVAREEKMDARAIKNVLGKLGRIRNNVVGFLLVNVQKLTTNDKFYSNYYAMYQKHGLLENKKN